MRSPARLLAAFALVSAAFAGCLDVADDVGTITDIGLDTFPNLDLPVFSAPMLIDEVRAGGEPVIAITQKGTILVSSHPGWTHYHPSRTPGHVGVELLAPANGQSYLWRSTDGGDTWTHIGLPMLEAGPRRTALGVSDPDLVVMADGTVCYTDLEGLAQASVACSTDDGVTWLLGNPIASERPVDRQWLAAFGNELYFTANYFTDRAVLVSTDRGLTWERRGDALCSGDFVANPRTGTLYVGCGNGVAVSTDGGRSFERRGVDVPTTRGMAEPAVDAADNVWMTYAERGEGSLHVIGSPDEGASWPWRIDLTESFRAFSIEQGFDGANGTYVWPWISAGSEGRFAVSWIGAYESGSSNAMDGPWFVFTAFVVDAHTDAPQVLVLQSTPDPIHIGPICQSGTMCQVASMQGERRGDRRLGDFFETTIDAEGFLHIVVSDAASRPDDVVSHVLYLKQTAGLRLVAEGEAWPTQG